MKLIIQIPCYNEEATLPGTLADLPREVQGFDSVEWLIIDDGSTDRTIEVARENGVDHIVRLSHNHGLASAFMAGLEAALRAGADVIVNTDGDNQYKASCIADLTAPILRGKAQIVIGARPITTIAHFSIFKRALQRLGSWVVRMASQTDVQDAPSGFRAIHKNAAMQLYVFDRYTYTLETIIQAGRMGMPVMSVPVEVNDPTRESRLIRSIPQYVMRSMQTILRIAVLYSPLRFFTVMAVFLSTPGIFAFVRFLYLYSIGEGDGHVQSLVIGTALIAAAAVTFVGGLIADLVAANRVLSAEIRGRLLKAELARGGNG
ncbi:glycosyltransferase family 2 protein [Jannaschia aquimarina]|uniref:Undecaprenyl-phosphate mannosyltransferase n=1 Tax=Jannaschia aquimarina TaxID=935700 RepID=A0A0D1EIG8_9RHOB|nr:glycosyltransferase family 2 protein [Jannaschia aquimarina]KIT16716.1 Undecaprenyl-phosphate mannosyltransferase [Jannaschia aquimarina]SNS54322.1 Glycosyltransferase involved in cell wall bisynthesis [Jannaschia aquimarina]